MWFKISASLGHGWAAGRAEVLARRLKQEQISWAENKAQECLAQKFVACD
jgi:hypothetical protein